MKLSLTKANKQQKELDEAFSTYIKSRDGWMCQICGSDYKPCCHHILPRELKEYRYSEDNAITLCLSHHKFDRSISAHNAPFAFFLWLQKFKPPIYAVAVERIKKELAKDGIQLNSPNKSETPLSLGNNSGVSSNQVQTGSDIY